jgi:hypothetical protein
LTLPHNSWNLAYSGRPIQPVVFVRQRMVVASAVVSALHDALMRL